MPTWSARVVSGFPLDMWNHDTYVDPPSGLSAGSVVGQLDFDQGQVDHAVEEVFLLAMWL